MPVTVKKKPGTNKYTVRTPGGVKSKGSTKENAKKQERLLNAIDHNPDFKPRKKR